MTNEHAIMVVESADKYLKVYKTNSAADLNPDGNLLTEQYLETLDNDYADLINIANLIEEDADMKVIARAISSLDTIVRDCIPDAVYYSYLQ
jgi:ferredoxin-fold anticodon binding domain-containing protein